MGYPKDMVVVGFNPMEAKLASDAVFRRASGQTINNSAAETEVFSDIIPANQLDIDRMYRVRLYGTLLNNSGGANGATIKVKFVGTTLVTDATMNAIASSANFDCFFIEHVLMSTNSKSSQSHFYRNCNAITAIGTAALGDVAISANTSTQDMSVDRQLSMTVTLSAANANLTWTTNYIEAEYF